MPGTTEDDSQNAYNNISPNVTDLLLSKSTIDIKMDDKAAMENCCWCHRAVLNNGPQYFAMCDGLRFCSEFCFIQSRRASFKKAKTCDCCKQVCQIVNYVDFQDGAVQLQFCSEKCLNQYKMQIFCKETQAHLDLIPHLKEQGIEAVNNGASLITPELWLKNCPSPSLSPLSPMSLTKTNVESESLLKSAKELSGDYNTDGKQKPLISVAPASKLMPNNLSIGISKTNSRLIKHNRRKRILNSRSVLSEGIDTLRHKKDLKIRDYGFGNTNSLVLPADNHTSLESNLSEEQNSEIRIKQCKTPIKSHNMDSSCIQNLYLPIPPPLAPMYNSNSLQSAEIPKIRNNSSTTVVSASPTLVTSVPSPSSTLTPRHTFLTNNNTRLLSPFTGSSPECPNTPSASAATYPLDLRSLNPSFSATPPITIMIPYPIIVPIPLPIPVPLPVIDFYKAYLTPEQRKKYEKEEELLKNPTSTTQSSAAQAQQDVNTKCLQKEPIDFTKVVSSTVVTKHESNIKTETEAETEAETEMEMETEKGIERESKQTTDSNNYSNSEDHISISNTKVQSVENSQSFTLHSTKCTNDTTNDLSKENQTTAILHSVDKITINRIESKEYDSTRPLRKRKRIIDCDVKANDETNNMNVMDMTHIPGDKDQSNKR